AGNGGEGGGGHGGCGRFDGERDLPGLVDGGRYGEVVLELHQGPSVASSRSRSSGVSMSVSLPRSSQATCRTSSACARSQSRAPTSPCADSHTSGQVVASRMTGLRGCPS